MKTLNLLFNVLFRFFIAARADA